MQINIAVASDQHVNSLVGLCPKKVQRAGGGIYTRTKQQDWMWDCWIAFWKRVGKARGKKVAVLLGESLDINKHAPQELVEYEHHGVVLDMGEEVFSVVLENTDVQYVLRSTEAHSKPQSYLDEMLAARIGAVQDDDGDYSHYHLYLEANGVTFDFQHHPQTSARRPWLKDSAAGRQAAITWDEYCESGRKPPDIVGRGHVHYWAQGYSRETYGFFTPPWQLCTPFGHRLGYGSSIEPLGGVVFTCEKGDWYRWKHTRFHPRQKSPLRI